MSTVAEEQVLVVPTSEFHALGHFQGFSADVDNYLPALLNTDQLSYRPRSQMEKDPSFKQLIPYVLFRHTDEAGVVRVFRYTRGSGQGEGRLHAKKSVGVGGHVSSIDATAGSTANVYREGLMRELAEEVSIDAPYSEQCVGLINDDETEVGRVHLGVVHVLDIERPAVEPRESEMLEAGFSTVEELLSELDRYETWSQIVIRALFD